MKVNTNKKKVNNDKLMFYELRRETKKPVIFLFYLRKYKKCMKLFLKIGCNVYMIIAEVTRVFKLDFLLITVAMQVGDFYVKENNYFCQLHFAFSAVQNDFHIVA